jgi:hypothetical protein
MATGMALGALDRHLLPITCGPRSGKSVQHPHQTHFHPATAGIIAATAGVRTFVARAERFLYPIPRFPGLSRCSCDTWTWSTRALRLPRMTRQCRIFKLLFKCGLLNTRGWGRNSFYGISKWAPGRHVSNEGLHAPMIRRNWTVRQLGDGFQCAATQPLGNQWGLAFWEAWPNANCILSI